MPTYIYDIEVYPNFFWLVTRDVDTGEYDGYGLEDRLLHDLIHRHDVCLIGWNNHSYDDLLLNYISQEAQTIVPSSGWGAQTAKPVTERSIFELSSKIIKTPRGDHSDTYLKQLRFDEKLYHSIDIKSLLDPLPGLKKIEMRTGFWNVQDLPVSPDTELTESQKETVKTYCINDVDMTYDIYTNHARTHLGLRRFLSDRFSIPLEKIQSASEPRTAEYILSTEATKNTYLTPWRIKESLRLEQNDPDRVVNVAECIPDWVCFNTPALVRLQQELMGLSLPINPSTGYTLGTKLKRQVEVGLKKYQVGIGGLHSIDQPGRWDSNQSETLVDADVTSYYPSILLRDNLHPAGYNDYWSEAYRQIYMDRVEAKRDDNRLVEAHALKIILNATFGKFGSQYSSFYDPTLLLRVTITGQLALLMLIEACSIHNIEVLSANTDGILVKLKEKQQRTWHTICAHWQTQTRMSLEYTYYKRYARRDVNSYTALTIDNKIKNKGVFTPKDIKHDVQAPVIQNMARASLLYNIEPKGYLASHWNELTIHDFIFHFGATKVYEMKLNDTPLTKSNRWYIGPDDLDNKLTKTGGKLQNTISIPNGSNIVLCNKISNDSIPNDLNQQYYLNKAYELIEACTHDQQTLEQVDNQEAKETINA